MVKSLVIIIQNFDISTTKKRFIQKPLSNFNSEKCTGHTCSTKIFKKYS